ncbi:hypothetical protein M1523_02055 [Patescibacteria group bacterium]|nr:hypothetical protein [Patescibacteria group bacterium]MCL5091995.1 hypothetical protein [Patescibacteria group bacterium]
METITHHTGTEAEIKSEQDKEPSWHHKSSLHVRLLAQDKYLDPNQTGFSPIEKTQIKSFTLRNYSPYEAISDSDRDRYYRNQAADFSQQMQTWVSDTREKLQSAGEFFHSTPDGVRWRQVFLGFGIDPVNLNNQQIERFYHLYLSDNNRSQLKRVVANFIKLHCDRSGKPDLVLIEQNNDVLEYISGYFGTGQTVDLVKELVMAEARWEVEETSLINNVNELIADQPQPIVRLNRLMPEEHRLLNYVWESLKTEDKATGHSLPTVGNQTVNRTDRPQLTMEKLPERPPAAVLTKETEQFLVNCNLNPVYLNPVPIGRGANHTVFAYDEPGQPKKVVKFPNLQIITGMNNGILDEDANISTMMRAFPNHVLPTETRRDPQSDRYCIVQQALKGQPLTNHNITPDLRRQLSEIVTSNQHLMEKEQLALDMTGMPGFLSWIKRKLRGDTPFELSNIMIDDQGKLMIIDYDLYKFNHGVGLRRRIGARLGFLVDRLMIHHYFGIDIQKRPN